MSPEEILKDYECSIRVKDFRVVKKAEFQVVVEIKFFSARTQSKASTTWSVWRSFNLFRSLDEQLRKRNSSHLKGIKFPRLYRRKTFFRQNLSSSFLETRMKELDTYLTMVAQSPQICTFHRMSIHSQSMKSFIGFVGGFGSNTTYAKSNNNSIAGYGTSGTSISGGRYSARIPQANPSSQSMVDKNYRWSGTGFLGSSSFAKKNDSSFSGSLAGSIGPRNGIPPSACPTIRESLNLHMTDGSDTGGKCHPKIEYQRAQMEQQLLLHQLKGVGMPPDGSCLLHCLVYEMYPLKCLGEYPPNFEMVNVGAADGMAPRRMNAALLLRSRLVDYAITHVKSLSKFLMQPTEELLARYKSFKDQKSEQATVAELYAAASMFNLKIVLVTNSPSFKIDPVLPVKDLPSIRKGSHRTLTLGYLIPANGLSGHYICTRVFNKDSPAENSFSGGSYRGSISVKPPTSAPGSSKGSRCSTRAKNIPRFKQMPEQRVE